MVFDVLRSGATETTDSGDTVTLAAIPAAALDTQAILSAGLLEPGVDEAECPSTIDCEIIEAQYRSTGPAATQYVNYDLADRENDLSIDYLVVHNTECLYARCIQLIKGEVEPTRFVSWHYTIRSVDGHVAQHVATRNVAAHAGNWYLNMHSIGFEHEGFAAQPGAWYTEALYRNSAELAKSPRRQVRRSSSTAPTWSVTTSSGRPPTSGTRAPIGTGSTTWSCSVRRSSPTGGAAAASSPSSPGSPTTRSR